MAYCPKCGNSKKNLDGTPCVCAQTIDDLYPSDQCWDIPEQYRSLVYNEALVKDSWGGSYRKALTQLHMDIITLNLGTKNVIFCSPAKHSKTVMAYSAMRFLTHKSIITFPLLDVLEVYQVMRLLDTGRKITLEVNSPESLYLVPFLFVRVPALLTNEVFQTMTTLIDRRTRKGKATVLLYNGTWTTLTKLDTFKAFTPLLGDGSFGTILNKSWKEVDGTDANENIR